MYAWLWRHLPGPTPVRVLLAAALFVAVVAVLFTWVFPWLEPRLPFTDVTVDTGTPAALSTGLSTG
jgi:small-conductance mechanosensitive channel